MTKEREAIARRAARRSQKPLIPAKAWEDAPQSPKEGYLTRIKPRATVDAYDAFRPASNFAYAGACLSAGVSAGGVAVAIMAATAYIVTGDTNAHLVAFYGLGHLLEVSLSTTAACTIVPVLAGIPYFARERRRQVAYRSVEAESLRAWLSERYGVAVSEGELGELVTLVHGQAGDSREFADERGTTLRMEWSAENGWLVVENRLRDYQPPGSIAQAEAQVTEPPQLAAPIEELLRGEAPVLHENYQSLLRTVRELDLDVEQAHVFKRVQQDMVATTALLRKAAKLGGPDAQQQAEIVQIFTELIEELQGLIGAQRSQLTRELRVQRTYVARRQPTSPGLRLPEVEPELDREEHDSGELEKRQL